VSDLGKALATWAPVFLATIGLIVLALALQVFINSVGFGYDYRAYDAAARRIASGDHLYLPGTVDAYRDGRYEGLYLYPPPVGVAFLPLTLTSESTATLIWILFRAGLLIAGCLALPVAWRVRLATLGIAGLSFPVLFDLNIGNVSIVIFALCAVAWRWMDSPVAAVAHAGLAAIRFPFGIFGFLWLVQRRFRALVWTVAAGLALIVISIPFVGLDTYAEYVSIVFGLPDISTGPHNFSFKSVALELGLPAAAVSLALPLSYALGLAAIWFAATRRGAAPAFVVTATATLLVAPFIHSHYLVLLLLPAALLMERGHWWAIGLPLIGWLPELVLPFAGPVAIGLVLALCRGPVTGTPTTPAFSGAA
jgi:hypothetical protein